jgi:hypothetical protein
LKTYAILVAMEVRPEAILASLVPLDFEATLGLK